ncbi:MAG: 50S ribosomal protein L3, partial [Atribacterota bacterium]|nr:50S ribosomal protein L3 [Atribacterota bacterium]
MKTVRYGMIGEKVGMTRIFSKDGLVIPVTVIKCGPCYVVQKRSQEKEGYQSLQLGYGEIKEKKLNKPRLGHLKKAGVPPLRFLAEFYFENINEYQV